MKRSFYSSLLFLVAAFHCWADEPLVLLGASYGKNVLAICEKDGTVLWRHQTEGPEKGHTGHHDIHLLPSGNILYHDSWVKVKEITLGKKVVWEYDTAFEDGTRATTHAFRRLADGTTVVVESNLGRIVHLDAENKITKKIPLGAEGRKKTRLMTMTAEGNYLVAAENPGVVTEYNDQGDIVWEYPTNTRVYGALRLKNGNTLICTGSGNSVLEVSPEKEIVWQITKDEIPGLTLGWMTDLQELPNGNLVLGNCHAGKGQPQIVEVNKAKEIIWSFDEWELVGNGLACWQILSVEESKLVREKLAAGE